MTSLRLLFVALLVSCSSLGGTSPIEWPPLAQCGPPATELVAVVSRILLDDGPPTQRTLTQRAHDELATLAQQHGPETVACLIDYWRNEWTSPGSAATPERVGAAARADNFLSEVGTQIEPE